MDNKIIFLINPSTPSEMCVFKQKIYYSLFSPLNLEFPTECRISSDAFCVIIYLIAIFHISITTLSIIHVPCVQCREHRHLLTAQLSKKKFQSVWWLETTLKRGPSIESMVRISKRRKPPIKLDDWWKLKIPIFEFTPFQLWEGQDKCLKKGPLNKKKIKN